LSGFVLVYNVAEEGGRLEVEKGIQSSPGDDNMMEAQAQEVHGASEQVFSMDFEAEILGSVAPPLEGREGRSACL
jgi:hypothetical protein